MADEMFENPRLAAIYDPFDPDRLDLDAYESMVHEFDARSVLDIGCGTGTFACRLAARGIKVIGIDHRENTYQRIDVPNHGVVGGWVDVTDVQETLVSFRWTYIFESDGAIITSDSTLRFRSCEEVAQSLQDVGLAVEGVREAPDRPGSEFVFIARHPDEV